MTMEFGLLCSHPSGVGNFNRVSDATMALQKINHVEVCPNARKAVPNDTKASRFVMAKWQRKISLKNRVCATWVETTRMPCKKTRKPVVLQWFLPAKMTGDADGNNHAVRHSLFYAAQKLKTAQVCSG